MASVEPGYIASPNAGGIFFRTYATDSAALANDGRTHTNGISESGNNSLDLRNDFRFEEMRHQATLLRRFSDSSSPDYVVNVRHREEKITKRVMELISKNYDKYGYQTNKNWFGNDGEGFWSHLGLTTPDLKNMPSGSLVCRHFAPIASILLHDAGVENHLVSSSVGAIKPDDTKQSNSAFVLNNGKDGPGNHAYVITQGGAIVEATTSGTKQSAYYPILNGVTARDIVDGRVAITTESLGGGFIYGSGTNDGSGRSSRVIEGQNAEIERFNQERQLLVAVQNNDITKAKELLDQGVYVNTQDAAFHTPLSYAQWNNNKEMIKLLESKGASLDPAPKRTEPAIIRNDMLSVKQIYEMEDRRWQADLYKMHHFSTKIYALGHSNDSNNPAVAILKKASRDKDGRIRLDDPNNIPIMREALEAERNRHQAIANENSSIAPRRMRGWWNDSVVTEERALAQIRICDAALTELNAPDYADRCRAHEQRRQQYIARLAEMEAQAKRVQQEHKQPQQPTPLAPKPEDRKPEQPQPVTPPKPPEDKKPETPKPSPPAGNANTPPAPPPQNNKPGIGDLLSNNKFGLLGLIAGLLLMMASPVLGFIATALLGIGGAVADGKNGLLGFGGNNKQPEALNMTMAKTAVIKDRIRESAGKANQNEINNAMKQAMDAMRATDTTLIQLSGANALPPVVGPAVSAEGIKQAAQNSR